MYPKIYMNVCPNKYLYQNIRIFKYIHHTLVCVVIFSGEYGKKEEVEKARGRQVQIGDSIVCKRDNAFNGGFILPPKTFLHVLARMFLAVSVSSVS